MEAADIPFLNIEEAKSVMRSYGHIPVTLQVQSLERLLKALEIEKHNSVKDPDMPVTGMIGNVMGMKVVEKYYLPENTAYLIDKTGRIIKQFKL